MLCGWRPGEVSCASEVDNLEITKLQAPDISCDHCIQTIHAAVDKVPGVRFVSGDADGKFVVVEYDPSLAQVAAIEQAMDEEGYPVKK
jgi:copper chaperone